MTSKGLRGDSGTGSRGKDGSVPVAGAVSGDLRPGLFESIRNFALELFTLSDKEDLYWYVAREVVGNLGFDDCVIYDLDRSRGLLVQVAAIGTKNPAGKVISNRLEIPLGQGITGSAAVLGQTVNVDNIAEDPRYILDMEQAGSEICVPLLIDGEVVGVIDCEAPEPGSFGESEQELLTSVAAMTSAKLKLLSEAEDAETRNQELYDINQRLLAEIDARRVAEDAVQTRNVWLRAILENAPIEIVLKDREGRIMAISDNVAREQASEAKDCLGKTTEAFVPAEVAAIYMQADQRVVTDGKPIQQRVIEEWEGRRRHFLNEKFPLRDDSGEIIGVCSITSDMTELMDAEDRLHHAQKLEAIGQLTGGIAHDVNNLLAVIQGNAELLQDDGGKGGDYLAAIIQATERGSDLTQHLLAFARQQPLSPQPIRIDALVRAATALLKRTLGPAIQVELDLPAGIWTTTVDPGQVENVILNLALNARDAMAEHGQLVIACSNCRLQGDEFEQEDGPVSGDFVCLEVTDNGCGMAPGTLERAFEPFFTTKEVGKGSGLGLSMVYGFAKQSGGHVTIASNEARGTKVRLYLPRSRGRPVLPHRETAEPTPGGRGERILVVDDEAEIRALSERLLTGLDYTVTVVADASAALAAIRTDGPFDLLLSDVLLGENRTGRDLAEAIREIQPAIAVVFMSGYPASLEETPADSLYLRKPFRRGELAAALRDALDREDRSPERTAV